MLLLFLFASHIAFYPTSRFDLFMHNKCGAKVSIIGAGFVGSTAAFTMLLQRVTNEIVLIDVHKEKAEGEAMDLKHGLGFVENAKITFGDDYALCAGSDVVVITAGASQKPGQTRLDLVKTNVAIFKKIVPQIVKHAPDAVLLVVTNPVDVMTFLALKYSKLPSNKVFGSGTSLDTARFQSIIGEKLSVDPKSIHAYILGEHGDSEFPVWSSATIGGVNLNEFPGFNKEVAAYAFQHTRNAAYEIINKKGATYYAIALTISDIVRSIVSDDKEVIPVSTLIHNYSGVSNICLSVPCIIGSNGVKKQLFPKLNSVEQKALKKSAQAIKSAIGKI